MYEKIKEEKQMFYLIKEAHTAPIRVDEKGLIEALSHHGQYEVVLEPENNPIYSKEPLTDMVDGQEVINDIMSDYSGEMTYPGCPMVVRGVMDCDPAEDPEFDLPCEDDYKNEYEHEYVSRLLTQLRKKYPFLNIPKDPQSIKISEHDRSLLYEAAEEAHIEAEGPYPNDEEIFDRYAKEY